MSPKNDTVVIVPTYNEKINLPQLLPAIFNAVDVHVLVVDDNSPDGTGKLADAMAQKNRHITVLHRPLKQGLGKAYLAGFSKALSMGFTTIVQMDADFSHSPEYLPEMLRLGQHFDLVLGSRWVQGGGTCKWPWTRQMISRGGSFYARTVLGVGIQDLTGGFKCFRISALRKIDFSQVRSNGYVFQIEMTYRVLKQGGSVIEMPIVFTERAHGKSKMDRSIVWEAVLKVPQLRFYLLP